MKIEITEELRTKTDQTIIRASLEEVGLSAPHDATASLELLVSYYSDNYNSAELVGCPHCGGVMLDEEDTCPFCGADNPLNSETEPETGESLPLPEKASSDLVLSEEPTSELVTADDLDNVVHEILTLHEHFVSNSYELGKRIASIHKSESWRLRKNEKGKPAYTNFKQFVRTELKFSPMWASQLMKVAETFDLETVAQIGPSKASLVLKAPEEKFDTMLEAARSGASKKELTEKLKSFSQPKKAEQPELKARSKKLTFVARVGADRRTASASDDPGQPAMTLADVPTTTFDFENEGVQIIVTTIQTPNGGIEHVLEFLRVED